jgi:hypothetical protein
VARETNPAVAAQRWRGVGYLLVATLLVGVAIVAIAWQLVGRGRRLFRGLTNLVGTLPVQFTCRLRSVSVWLLHFAGGDI